MRSSLLILCFVLPIVSAYAQLNIVDVIDDLRIRWDQTAISLKDYQGIQNHCASDKDKLDTYELLDQIHHWDTTLYFIVQGKFDVNKDKEAAATLEDIEKLETEYSTEKFKHFIQDECTEIENIVDGFESGNSKEYEKKVKKFEKELVKYLTSITYRVDIIDEHIHHLDFKD